MSKSKLTSITSAEVLTVSSTPTPSIRELAILTKLAKLLKLDKLALQRKLEKLVKLVVIAMIFIEAFYKKDMNERIDLLI